MVSRIYTPPVAPYARSQGALRPRGSGSATEESTAPGQDLRLGGDSPQRSATSQEGLSGISSAGLKSVQYDRFQKIPLNTVLDDFHRTMTALGTNEATRNEVGVYMQAISLQGVKAQPDIPYIKHTLRTAANTLDHYISNTLGQPSKVVREWVDALLLQNIDFHSDEPFKLASDSENRTKAGNVVETPAEKMSGGKAEGLNVDDKKQLKALIETAKAAHQSGDDETASLKIREALTQLKGRGVPDWEGKVYRLQGRFAEGNGQWEQALASYAQAEECFVKAGRPDRQADTRQAIASLLEDQGRLDEAKASYQQVLMLDEGRGDMPAQVRTLQDLGRVDLRLGNAHGAIETLDLALTRSQGADLPDTHRSELLGMLGSAYRRAGQLDSAMKTYNQAARIARTAGEPSLYADTLRQYASVLLEGGRQEQALKVLQALKSIRK